jgi:hypothetical protein
VYQQSGGRHGHHCHWGWKAQLTTYLGFSYQLLYFLLAKQYKFGTQNKPFILLTDETSFVEK